MWTKRIMLKNLLGDVVGDNTFSMGGSSFSVDNALRDSLASEVSKLVEKVEVAEDDGAVGTSGHRVLIVIKRRTLRICNITLLHRFTIF
jgi:hypothetical protein